MKRKSKKNDGSIKWKKTGGGSFRMVNRIIKPGQIFSARPDEIPMAFRDIIIPLEDIPTEKVEQDASNKKEKFTIVKISNSKFVNIVDASKKVINENKLTPEEAEVLIEELQK